jgi:hypothetical protein
MEKGITVAVALFAGGAIAGCSGARIVQPGLASVAALPGAASIEAHDVVSNGHDSCPRARIVADDPLPHRYPPCLGGESAHPSVGFNVLTTPAPAPTDPGDFLWNLHLRGLPPCKGGVNGSALSAEDSVAVCRRD